MSLRFDLRENFHDTAVFADNERGPLDAHHFLSVHILLFQDVVRYCRFLIHVAEKRERQIVLGFESCLSRRRVGRNADYCRAFFAELLDRVTKLVSFGGSAGCVGTRKEIQHHLLTLELR